MTKNCIGDADAISSAIKHVKEIIGDMGKVNLVYPAYKVSKAELKKYYKEFAEALARKILINFDGMNEKNKMMVEIYELSAALSEIAEKVLEIVTVKDKKKNFSPLACF